MPKPETVRGHKWERDIVNKLKERGWDAATSRYASRRLDDQGIDISSDDYPVRIQCKSTNKTINIQSIFDTTSADAIFWRHTEKKNKRFYVAGEYAIVRLEDYLDLIDNLRDYEQI